MSTAMCHAVRRILLEMILAGFIATIACGCEAPPPSATQKNINTFTLAQQKVTQARSLVGDTLVSLRQYCAQPALPTYTAFAQNATATKAIGGELRDIRAVMTDQGEAFFADWESEIAAMTSADLKARTTARRASALATFQQIDIQAPAARAAYDRFVADLNNLQTFFDYDKTVAGVAAASKVVAQTNVDGAELERQLDFESANLNQVKAAFVTMQRG